MQDLLEGWILQEVLQRFVEEGETGRAAELINPEGLLVKVFSEVGDEKLAGMRAIIKALGGRYKKTSRIIDNAYKPMPY